MTDRRHSQTRASMPVLPVAGREDLPLLASTVVALEFDRGDSSVPFDKGKIDFASKKSPEVASSSSTSPSGSASAVQTALNISKTCMGTGTLALPFAASQGGLLFNVLGLALVALWNYFCMERLLMCLDLLPPEYLSGENGGGRLVRTDTAEESSEGSRCRRHRRTRSAMQRQYHSVNSDFVAQIDEDLVGEEDYYLVMPPEGTTTMGAVAFFSLGKVGLNALDVIMAILLMGVLISYEDAILSFLKDTPVTTGSQALDSIWTVLVIATLSCVSDMKFLSQFSAAGLLTLFFTFATIAGHGMRENGFEGFRMVSWDSLWPKSVSAASSWFGVTAFGFGVVPITYNIQESMSEPSLIMMSARMGLCYVFATYVAISDGLAIMFSPSVTAFEGDILKELPQTWVLTAVRLSMTFVVIVTAPLLVMPCGELIEGKLGFFSRGSRTFVRFTICLCCTGVSVVVPGFVDVISFIGCLCVALVSFTFPPLFHFQLTQRRARSDVGGHVFSSEQENGSKTAKNRQNLLYADAAMTVIGLVATITTSTMTFLRIIEHSDR